MPLALAYDADGRLYWAGHDQGQVWFATESQPDPLTVGPLEQVTALDVCIEPTGGGALAAAGVDAAGQSGIYLFALPKGQPIRVTNTVAVPQLVCNPDGGIHLGWQLPTGLAHATSSDWAAITTLAAPPDAPWVMTSDGSSQVRLAWATDRSVIVASSRDWTASHTTIDTGSPAEAIEMAASSTGLLGLLWTTTVEGSSASSLRYLARPAPLRQLHLLSTGKISGMRPGATWAVASNTALADIQATRFYLMAREGPTAGAWQQIGEDADGSDGFDVTLPDDLIVGLQYTVIAQAELADGSHLVGQSAWLLAESALPVLLALPEAVPWRGTAAVNLLPLDERSQDQPFELWMEPLPQEEQSVGPYYLGAYLLPADAPAGEWLQWSVDSRAIPDGRYRLAATRWSEGRRAAIYAADEVWIDNACLPNIEQVEAHIAGRQRDRLRVTVTADDVNGSIERVDAFLVPRSLEGASGDSPVWLGSDATGDGGWIIEVPIAPEWRGSAWSVRAIAYDNDDYDSQPVESDTLMLPPQGLAMRFLRPSSGPSVQTRPIITVIIDEGVELIDTVTFYLYTPQGLQSLGTAEPDGRLASLEMDARGLASGSYRLLAHLQGAADGSWWTGPVLQVREMEPQVELLGPRDVPPAPVRHEVLSYSDEPLVGAHCALIDEDGNAADLGAGRVVAGVADISWNAGAFLPGEYELLCTLVHQSGQQTSHRWPLCLADAYGLANIWPAGNVLQDEIALDWSAATLPEELALALTYSPDGGGHWVPVIEATALNLPQTLDTTHLPDSPNGRFRLTWNHKGIWGQVDSGPMVVQNRPPPPTLTVLEPRPGQLLPVDAPIIWQAHTADGGDVAVEIAVRRVGEAWRPLATGLAASGRYTWATTGLQLGPGWEIEVVAVDDRGERQRAVVSDLTLTHNRPPRVRLIWPDSDVTLNGETAILWSAFDLDGDTVTIDLYYSDDAGQAWYPLAEGLPNTGYFLWETAFVPPGSAYRVRAVARDDLTERRAQSAGISIVGGAASPEVRLMLPTADTAVRRTTLVCWQTLRKAGLETVSIEARELRTGAIEPVAAGEPVTGCTVWDTLYVPDGQYALTITGRDAEGMIHVESGHQLRVANLTPDAPQIEWTELPSLGWQNSPIMLGWRSTAVDGAGAKVWLEASADLGATWKPLASMSAEANSMLWGPPPGQLPTLLRMRLSAAGRAVQSPTRVFYPAPDSASLPELAVSVAASDGRAAVRWLAQDDEQHELDITIVGVNDLGRQITLAQGLAEVGELAIDTIQGDRPLTAVCVLADNGHMTRMVCNPNESRPGWSVELLSPEPGTPWDAATVITWRLSSGEGVAPSEQRLWWSDDGRRTWHDLTALDGRARRYVWDEKSDLSGPIWLRFAISASDRSALFEAGPWSASQTRPTPVISLISPPPGKASGSVMPIRWSSTNAPVDATTDLWYRTAPRDTWRSLARGLPSSGQFVWDVTALPNASQVWLRAELIASEQAVANSPVHRLVTQPQALPRVRLSGQGFVLPEAVYTVCWQAEANHRDARVRLLTSLDGGVNWSTLAEGLALTGCRRVPGAQLQGDLPLLRALVIDGSRQGIATIAATHSQP